MLRFLIVLALLMQDAPKQSVELRVRPVQGDKIETFATWSHGFRGTLGDEPVSFATRGGQRLVVEMSGVEKGSLARKTVKVVDSYVETKDMQTSKYIRKDDAVLGRTVTITMKDGREERTGGDGVPEQELKALTFVDPLTRLYPDKPVAVGDSWDISGEGLKLFFPGGDFTDGRILVSLREIREYEGRKCAFLSTKYDVSGTMPDGVSRQLELTGTLIVWIERGYILVMTQSGRLKTSGADPKTQQPNGEAIITGELKATILEK